MYVLDTDHLSVLDRGGISAQPLLNRLNRVNPTQVFTTIISYEEQMRGWLSYLGKIKDINRQIVAYQELKKQLNNYCKIPLLDFDHSAAEVFIILKRDYPRLGTMDLKIASIVLSNQAILLTRNLADFQVIENLKIENWAN